MAGYQISNLREKISHYMPRLKTPFVVAVRDKGKGMKCGHGKQEALIDDMSTDRSFSRALQIRAQRSRFLEILLLI